MKVKIADEKEQYSHILVTFEVNRPSWQAKIDPTNRDASFFSPPAPLLAD